MPSKIEDRVMQYILALITGANASVDECEKRVQVVLEKWRIDILSCNGVNLVIEAIKAHDDINHPMVQMLKARVTEKDFLEAQKIAGRIVDDVATVDIAPLDTSPEAEPADPPAPVRTIFDAVNDNGDDLAQIISDENINQKEGEFTPIQIAAINGFKKAVKLLYEKGATTDGLDIAALIGGNEDVIGYLTDAKLYTLEQLTFKAASNDKHTEVLAKLLITLPNGVEVYLCEEGLNALHVATKQGAVANIVTAIDGGIPVESKTESGFTALQTSVLEGQVDSFKTLLTKHADVFVEDTTTGANILHLAAKTGDAAMAKEIIDLQEGPGLAKGVDSTGANPVHTAATLGNRDVIGTILKTLSDEVRHEVINAKDNEGHSVLSMACDEATRELLTDNGAIEPETKPEVAEPSTPPPAIQMNPVTPVKQIRKDTSLPPTPASKMKIPVSKHTDLTPYQKLIFAINDDNASDVSKILGGNPTLDLLGAKVMMQGSTVDVASPSSEKKMDAMTMLQFAHYMQKPAALKAMTDVWVMDGLKELMQAIYNDDTTAINKALEHKVHLLNAHLMPKKASGASDTGVQLAENGVDTTWLQFAEHENHMSPLHVAVVLGKLNAVKELIKSGALVDDADLMNGYTAMHYAVESNNVEVVKLLKTSYKKSLKTSRDKETAEEMAAFLGHKDVFMKLAGNDISYTHLLKAIKGKNPDMVSEILKIKTNSEFLTKSSAKIGDTALMEAIKTGDVETFKAVFERSTSVLYTNLQKQHILHYIAKYGNLDMLVVAHSKGDEFNILVGIKDAGGNTPLHIAASRDKTHYDDLKGLLSKYTKTEIKKGFFSSTKITTEVDVSSWPNNDHKTAAQIQQNVVTLVVEAEQSFAEHPHHPEDVEVPLLADHHDAGPAD